MSSKEEKLTKPNRFEQLNVQIVNPLDYVEAWFDNHPEPYNIDCHQFEFGRSKVYVYFADLIFETWLIKMECHSAQRALYYSKLFYKTTSQMNITQILKNKTLFLFTDKRF